MAENIALIGTASNPLNQTTQPGYELLKMNDGIVTTAWQSKSGVLPQKPTITFNLPQIVDKVDWFGLNESYVPSDGGYIVQYQDTSGAWHDITPTSNEKFTWNNNLNAGRTVYFNSITVYAIGVHITQCGATTPNSFKYPAFYEFRVYASIVPVVPTPTPEPCPTCPVCAEPIVCPPPTVCPACAAQIPCPEPTPCPAPVVCPEPTVCPVCAEPIPCPTVVGEDKLKPLLIGLVVVAALFTIPTVIYFATRRK